MSIKNIAGIAVLVVVVAFAIQLVQQRNVQARQTSTKAATQTVQAIEYAILEVDADGSNVTWLIGGNDRVYTESVKSTYRRLGGRGQGSFSDLLNQIGSDGWSLNQKDDSIWIFSRLAQQ
ncbi:hypothetical protein [Mariniblastus fucicola]|uniref:Uncharacterized protein n=1 Tax=Mariniblastus fucicola TaxID=980251 RepID=A0A5B9P999_9BACT|nr:hypothetical protein [Mariniblastus fucicola]QEG21216.1 hypothetical protein MFFC18_10710 [Mariniblastus fucicola]